MTSSISDAEKAQPIVLPSLGREVQLGQFYNAYTNTFYDGFSAWSAEQVKTTQIIKESPHTDFTYSVDDEERNKNAGLDVEGSVSLQLALFSVTGSAKYLNETKSHAYEARVGATCHVKTRERGMPMDQIVNRKFDMVLAKPDFTHFVSRVVEGGQAHLSVSKKCSSSEEESQLKGALEGTLRKFVTVEGSLSLDKKDVAKEHQSSYEVKLTGDYNPTNSIVSFEDAVEEAAHLPQRLKGKTHTLTVHLLPVNILDPRALRICRSLDQTDMLDVSTKLGDFQQAQLQLDYTSKEVVNKKWFPNIYKQVQSMAQHLRNAYIAFKNVCTTILPQLRGAGAEDEATPKLKAILRNAIKKANSAVKIADRFVEAKKKEKRTIDRILKEADRQQIINDLTNDVSTSSRCLSLSLAAVDTKEHFLQKKLGDCEELITSSQSGNELARDDDYDADDYDDDDEWYQNDSTTMDNVFSNLNTLGRTKKINEEGKVLESMKYCIGRIAKIRKIPVPCGNIVAVDERGRTCKAIFHGQLTGVSAIEEKKDERPFVSVQWNDESPGDDISKCRVTYWKIFDDTEKPSSNEEGGTRQKKLKHYKDFDKTSLPVTFPEGLLEDGCYYGFSVQTLSKFVGLSPSSDAVKLQTSGAPSIVSKIVEFYNEHEKEKSILRSGWEFDKETGFLVVGRKTDERYTKKDEETEHVAVDVVDVMPEYERDIPVPEDDEEAKVVLMTGESGHGRSTHINGFFNWIFRITAKDPIRLLLVDNREHGGLRSITKKITVYRIRPHTGCRIKQPLYLIDCPDFGIEAEENVARMYKELFLLLTKIDCVALVMRATEDRCGQNTKAILRNVLHQFGENVKDNIIALLTFADVVAKPPALLALGELKVPLDQSVTINNASFVCASETTRQGYSEEFIQLYWRLYEAGNRRMFEGIQLLAPVLAGQSAEVKEKRTKLNEGLDRNRESFAFSAKRCNKISADLDVMIKTLEEFHRQDVIVAQFSNGVIAEWSDDGRSIESAVLKLINELVKEQKIILESLHSMYDLQKQLCVIALCHNPKGILDYVDSLIAEAKTRGATAEVEGLCAARYVINLSDDDVGKDADTALKSSEKIKKVIEKVKTALEGRVKMSQTERRIAQHRRSLLNDELYNMLPTKYQLSVYDSRVFGGYGRMFPFADVKTDFQNVISVIKVLLRDGIFAMFQSKES